MCLGMEELEPYNNKTKTKTRETDNRNRPTGDTLITVARC